MCVRGAMNLPNSLTVTRIFLVPLLVVVLLTKFEGRQILGMPKELVGAAIFGFASLTDWADGYLARRRKQVTALGQFIDPLADKLLTLGGADLAGADGPGAGLDGRHDHRPRVRGHRAPQPGLRARRGDAGLAARQDEDGRAGRGDSRADSLARPVELLLLVGRVALWAVVIAAIVSAADYFRRFNLVLNAPRTSGLTAVPTSRADRRVG